VVCELDYAGSAYDPISGLVGSMKAEGTVDTVLTEIGLTGCGYEVLGMLLLQAYLFIYSLLRGVTFEVPPLEQLCT